MIPKITNDGYGLMIRALDGDGIHFSAIVIGNGDAPDDYASLKQLVNPVLRIGIEASVRKSANYYTLSGTVSNAEIENGFQFTELGVFAQNPEGGDDILYAYAYYSTSGYDAPSYIPSYKTCSFEITEKVHVYVGDAEDVSAALVGSANYATKNELSNHTDDHDNPHNVTKQQVGLGNVENLSPANLAVEYTKASTLSELVSGEILSSVLSKLAAAVSAVISHIGNNVLHITAAERTKWNGKAEGTHYHAATQINSGVLGIARGGTGAANAEAAIHALGGVYAGTVSSTYRIPSSANLNSYTTGGTYWCTSGDVAKTLKNSPYTSTNFVFLVFAPSPAQVFQMILPNHSNDSIAIYFRALNDKWGPWKKVTTSTP